MIDLKRFNHYLMDTYTLGNLIQLGCLLAELTHSHTLGKQPVRHGLRNSSYPRNRCCLTAV